MIASLAVLGALISATAPPPVVWTTPSADVNGTMPLGNGEIGVNAWVDAAGDLRFYFGRTDTWDEHGRLLKIGALRVRVGDGSTGRTKVFRQALEVERGRLTCAYGQGDERVELALWVDANRPVIVVEATTAQPQTAEITAELWRTVAETLASVECSDIYNARPEKTVVPPDTILAGLRDRIGWYHENQQSVGPKLCAEIQGVASFERPDPLLGRTFGALVRGEGGRRIDDTRLGSVAGTRHVFEIAALTEYPSDGRRWQAAAEQVLEEADRLPLDVRRAEHEAWWQAWGQRSWIRLSGSPQESHDGVVPANPMNVRVGCDSHGGSRFHGAVGLVVMRDGALDDAAVAKLAAERGEATTALGEQAGTAGLVGRGGLTLAAWIKPDELLAGGQRILDKITVGESDGFLLDAYPGPGLRCIVGPTTVSVPNVLKAGEWQHVAAVVGPDGVVSLYVNGKRLPTGAASGAVAEGSDAEVVSRAYLLQRYVQTCAGRGRYPIKFNGSLFTVPSAGAPGDADYRRWGPGYWWQNTRLPYYSMCAAGDYEQMEPLFRMYARDLLPLAAYRTKVNLGHAGAYIPECIYFWGDMFTETYGWQPAAERKDKLQASGWHKYEWVSGLELCWLLLDTYDHTGDTRLLSDTLLPTARQILTFFDQHYGLDEQGKLKMTPSQALETWWDCTNPMPELAGLHAVTQRLLALGDRLPAGDRAFVTALAAKLAPLPTRDTPDGPALAPAARFANKPNIENPELYAVFPFRLCSFDRDNRALGERALTHRWDRGDSGWRQDSLFAAYLGQADETRRSLVKRARSKHSASRFPVFWGPNYDWIPDQDHGSVLLATLQSMLMQTDGSTIWLLPAWPKDWDCEFRLHAPGQTTLTGRVRGGRVEGLVVTPKARAADVVIVPPAMH